MNSAMADENAFERPILEIQKRIEEISGFGGVGREREIEKLQRRLAKVREDVYSRLTPWQVTLVARHPKRPCTADYIRTLFTDFVEMHGDRKFADDPAILAGFALYHGQAVAIIGHQKGLDTKEKIRRNFGMPRPEGYRKAIRAMRMAEKFRHPIITFIDTPGAYPGIGAEERGQAEAIAYSLREMARLSVPIVATVTGEGGSGGALALGVGNRVNILEHAVYSVISPEGCAAILWRDSAKNREAAEAMRLTAPDLLKLNIVDEIIPEVNGGAHVDTEKQATIVGDVIERQLDEMKDMEPAALTRARYDRFRRIGVFEID